MKLRITLSTENGVKCAGVLGSQHRKNLEQSKDEETDGPRVFSDLLYEYSR